MTKTERPTWKSDGYVALPCDACGQRIGYGRFVSTGAPGRLNKDFALIHTPVCPSR